MVAAKLRESLKHRQHQKQDFLVLRKQLCHPIPNSFQFGFDPEIFCLVKENIFDLGDEELGCKDQF